MKASRERFPFETDDEVAAGRAVGSTGVGVEVRLGFFPARPAVADAPWEEMVDGGRRKSANA